MAVSYVCCPKIYGIRKTLMCVRVTLSTNRMWEKKLLKRKEIKKRRRRKMAKRKHTPRKLTQCDMAEMKILTTVKTIFSAALKWRYFNHHQTNHGIYWPTFICTKPPPPHTHTLYSNV